MWLVVVVVVYSQFLYRYKQTQSAKTRFRQAGARQRVVQRLSQQVNKCSEVKYGVFRVEVKVRKEQTAGLLNGGAGFEPATSVCSMPSEKSRGDKSGECPWQESVWLSHPMVHLRRNRSRAHKYLPRVCGATFQKERTTLDIRYMPTLPESGFHPPELGYVIR